MYRFVVYCWLLLYVGLFPSFFWLFGLLVFVVFVFWFVCSHMLSYLLGVCVSFFFVVACLFVYVFLALGASSVSCLRRFGQRALRALGASGFERFVPSGASSLGRLGPRALRASGASGFVRFGPRALRASDGSGLVRFGPRALRASGAWGLGRLGFGRFGRRAQTASEKEARRVPGGNQG